MRNPYEDLVQPKHREPITEQGRFPCQWLGCNHAAYFATFDPDDDMWHWECVDGHNSEREQI